MTVERLHAGGECGMVRAPARRSHSQPAPALTSRTRSAGFIYGDMPDGQFLIRDNRAVKDRMRQVRNGPCALGFRPADLYSNQSRR